MSRINKTGGPAFPVWELNGHSQPEMTGFGMTLRDYFAAKALQGYMNMPPDDLPTRETIAKDCYRIADAMLKARKQ